MRRLYWYILIAALIVLWVVYTWGPSAIRSTIDGALAPVGAGISNALTGTYNAVVTSPFWQTWIAPSLNSWIIGMVTLGVIIVAYFRLKPRFKRPAIITRQAEPEFQAQVIQEAPAKPIAESAPEKEEAEA